MTLKLRVLSVAILILVGTTSPKHTHADQTKNRATESEAAHSGYVGSKACAGCHVELYRQFIKTSMGRSMSVAGTDLPQNAETIGEYVNQHLNRKWEVYSKSGQLFQSESGINATQGETFREANQLKWIIGAGTNGFGAIIQKDDYLFQAPLSYYSKAKGWSPSPGYEFADLGFNRPILPGCIACHSGRPNSIAETNGKFASEPFSELAIGCERCHGPGAAHVLKMHTSKSGNKQPDDTIVNPARLTPYLTDNICIACHQAGDVRVLQPGKTYADIQPGHPLADTVSILMVPPTKESPPNDDHVDHYYSMTMSKCYRASQGRMSCTTCHDPHTEPTQEEAATYFAAKCLTCHTNQSCKMPSETRLRQSPTNNCIGCHMPKREIREISHSSATNHRIVATPNEPFPEIAFRQTTSALPDLIYLNAPPLGDPSVQPSPPSPLTLLSAYGELSDRRPEYLPRYLKVMDQLERTQSGESQVQAAVGRKALKSGDLVSATSHLRMALRGAPQVANTYTDLADALAKQGESQEAIAMLEKAIELDRFNPIPHKMLVVNLVTTRQYDNAHKALQRYLALFPQDDFMRQMLDRAERQHPN